MFTVFTEQETGGQPPEREPGPSADGDPGRSRNGNNAFSGRTTLVLDDTQKFEEPQTGISLTCDPTDAEIRKCLGRIGILQILRGRDIILAVLTAIVAIIALMGLVEKGGSSGAWAVEIFLLVTWPLYFLIRFRNVRAETKKYRRSGMEKLEIYPGHIELKQSGGELPLDGAGYFFRTEEAFALVFPPKNKARDRSLRYVIIPLRCVGADVLPYVEAMLVAGTKPQSTN